MPQHSFDPNFRLNPMAHSDRERLERAEMAVNLAKLELDGLELDADDLHYLVEIVQLGLQRVRESLQSDKAIHVQPGPGLRSN